ncbi:aquaporin, Major intrinsic protein family [Rhizoctonia solani]|uniref:Inositol oxygenase n=1 Tax=Rhizoctonia solani TaxID=456999 RepID=A0A8H8NT38_9AGAM|nr:aquaporin, Major intrinsic protein family [Rhizoctonia solani]QRW18830.1 aquaporin, Major intrinsic protein family [Rhizoctonia solani]
MRMPVYLENNNRDGRALDEVSDAVDDGKSSPLCLSLLFLSHPIAIHSNLPNWGVSVNIAKLKAQAQADAAAWDSAAQFDSEKDKAAFRDYEAACDRVKSFYKASPRRFLGGEEEGRNDDVELRREFEEGRGKRARMGVWEAIEMLETLVDDSDPDTELSQIEHLLQTAEAIRRDGKPEWMQVVGLVHDLGKLLYFFGSEGQWDVVGDTFVVGCAFPDEIIYPGSFTENPDSKHSTYSTKYGIYEPNCGLDNVMLSWGHDEYLYHVMKDQSSLPEEGLAMIRKAMDAVLAFNPYDLYSKSDEAVNPEKLKPYYQGLIAKFFPPELDW